MERNAKVQNNLKKSVCKSPRKPFFILGNKDLQEWKAWQKFQELQKLQKANMTKQSCKSAKQSKRQRIYKVQNTFL